MSAHKIHLLYEPWRTMSFEGTRISVPSIFRYGHVYCVLEKDGVFISKDVDGLTETHVDNDYKSGSLSGIFSRLMRCARLKVSTQEDVLFIADETSPVASFEISENDYEQALEHFRNMNGRIVNYDRVINNCVRSAAQDLRAANLDMGTGFGYTAGRFFYRVLKRSQGNLLAPPLGIEVVERVVSL